MYFTVLIFLYLPVSTRILSFFRCDEVGDSFRIASAMDIHCYTNSWYLFSILALCGVGLFVFGVPSLLLYLVKSRRQVHVDGYIQFVHPTEQDLKDHEAFMDRVDRHGNKWWFKLWYRQRLKELAIREETEEYMWKMATRADSKHPEQAYQELLQRDFDNAVELAKADELSLSVVPTLDKRRLVDGYLRRQNLRSLHTVNMYGRLFGKYHFDRWWYEVCC